MSTPNLNADDDAIIGATRNWLERAVIGVGEHDVALGALQCPNMSA